MHKVIDVKFVSREGAVIEAQVFIYGSKISEKLDGKYIVGDCSGYEEFKSIVDYRINNIYYLDKLARKKFQIAKRMIFIQKTEEGLKNFFELQFISCDTPIPYTSALVFVNPAIFKDNPILTCKTYEELKSYLDAMVKNLEYIKEQAKGKFRDDELSRKNRTKNLTSSITT